MIRLTADKTPMQSLEGLHDTAEVYNGDGKLLGVYVPANLDSLRRENGDVNLTISEEEIQRRLSSKRKGVSSLELFEHLLSLATEKADRDQLLQIIEEVKERDRCASR